MNSPNQEQSPSGVHIEEDRRMIALEATWEIEQLVSTIRELCDDLLPSNELGSPLRLRVRGLTTRINDLVCVAMSVLDDDVETCDLSSRVYGDSATRRGSVGGPEL